MTSFLLTVFRLLRALAHKISDPEFRSILILVIILLISGTVFYSTVEGWHWIDSLYFSVITLSTVGYGDFSPKTDLGKVFTIIYIFVGLGLFIAIVRDLADDMISSRNIRKEKKSKDLPDRKIGKR
jgi:voltage-gated potassium channel